MTHIAFPIPEVFYCRLEYQLTLANGNPQPCSESDVQACDARIHWPKRGVYFFFEQHGFRKPRCLGHDPREKVLAFVGLLAGLRTDPMFSIVELVLAALQGGQ